MIETKIREELDDRAADIIKLINKKFVYKPENQKNQENSSYQRFIGESNDGKRQFTDLVEASTQTCCIDEFKLYIEYKGSKQGSGKQWKWFAKDLNSTIDELMESIADSIVEKLRKTEAKVDAEAVRLEVLRRFCGYLMWRTSTDFSRKPQRKEGGKQ